MKQLWLSFRTTGWLASRLPKRSQLLRLKVRGLRFLFPMNLDSKFGRALFVSETHERSAASLLKFHHLSGIRTFLLDPSHVVTVTSSKASRTIYFTLLGTKPPDWDIQDNFAPLEIEDTMIRNHRREGQVLIDELIEPSREHLERYAKIEDLPRMDGKMVKKATVYTYFVFKVPMDTLIDPFLHQCEDPKDMVYSILENTYELGLLSEEAQVIAKRRLAKMILWGSTNLLFYLLMGAIRATDWTTLITVFSKFSYEELNTFMCSFHPYLTFVMLSMNGVVWSWRALRD